MSGEAKALIAVGKAQGVLLKSTRDLLKEDKTDGLKMAGWLKKHSELFTAMRSDYEGCAIDDEDLIAASKGAGEPHYLP